MRPFTGAVSTRLTFYSLIVILFQLIVSTAATASGEVKLAMEPVPSLSQKGTPIVECAFAKIGRPVQIISVPWARAQVGTEHGTFDGFFMASRNDKRDRYAVISEPFFNIEWLYVVRKDSGLTPDDPEFMDKNFAANLGSARLMWLLEKFDEEEITQQVIVTANSTNSLNMLSLGRIDVNLENNENLKTTFENTGLNPSDFRTFVAKSTPVGVYFGNAFLKLMPDFLDKFNTAVKACK